MVSHIEHRTTDAIEQNNKDKKKFLGEHGRGKTIDTIDHQTIIREAETDLQELLYLDIVEFRGKRRKDRWFPTTYIGHRMQLNKKLRQKHNGRGKRIDRIDHQIIICEAKNDLQEELASIGCENHVRTKPSTPTHGPLLAPQPQWPECGTLLDNRMLEIIEEDVRVTLALPLGPLEVHVASTCEPKRKYTKLLEL
ncbi:hypothetical protein Cgig2_002761 [Carnegiea gigantea]|uniref:Uncharacterized protein n=1 Tax=Carnegiea gigantea TaxID=171969 RepID=A0A9Q1H101_9CARY|nr:hypothetical protein Cgig2_002761 [Carnegiea gigantea]